jgi:hypothetical protein
MFLYGVLHAANYMGIGELVVLGSIRIRGQDEGQNAGADRRSRIELCCMLVALVHHVVGGGSRYKFSPSFDFK